MDQMTSHDPRPKILEHSLTLHPETFLLNTTEITVQSREEQAKPVCASGTLGVGSSAPPERPLCPDPPLERQPSEPQRIVYPLGLP